MSFGMMEGKRNYLETLREIHKKIQQSPLLQGDLNELHNVEKLLNKSLPRTPEEQQIAIPMIERAKTDRKFAFACVGQCTYHALLSQSCMAIMHVYRIMNFIYLGWNSNTKQYYLKRFNRNQQRFNNRGNRDRARNRNNNSAIHKLISGDNVENEVGHLSDNDDYDAEEPDDNGLFGSDKLEEQVKDLKIALEKAETYEKEKEKEKAKDVEEKKPKKAPQGKKELKKSSTKTAKKQNEEKVEIDEDAFDLQK